MLVYQRVTGWWFGTWILVFQYIGNIYIIIPTDELIFFRGLKPPTRWWLWLGLWFLDHNYSSLLITMNLAHNPNGVYFLFLCFFLLYQFCRCWRDLRWTKETNGHFNNNNWVWLVRFVASTTDFGPPFRSNPLDPKGYPICFQSILRYSTIDQYPT